MVRVIIPESHANVFRSRWQFRPLERMGYSIAYKPNNDLLICMVSSPTDKLDRGTAVGIRESNEQAQRTANIWDILTDKELELLAVHSNSTEEISEQNKRTLKSLISQGIYNSLIITSTRITSYNTSTGLAITPNTVQIVSDSEVSRKCNKMYKVIEEILFPNR
jgi:hypothetical protein